MSGGGRDWIERAAAGELPAWTEASPARRAHMGRVAVLLDEWAGDLQLGARERSRWRAAGWLHDTLRDADGEALRPEAPPPYDTLPAGYLHGPVAAARLERDGADDPSVLAAIRHHTMGDAGLDRLGLALIAADYLEPGRQGRRQWRGRLRARMPGDFEDVVRELIGDKLRRALEGGVAIRPEMIGLWNRLSDAGSN